MAKHGQGFAVAAPSRATETHQVPRAPSRDGPSPLDPSRGPSPLDPSRGPSPLDPSSRPSPLDFHRPDGLNFFLASRKKVIYIALVLEKEPPLLAHRVAGLAASVHANARHHTARGGAVAALHAIILAAFARLLDQLAEMVELWRAGQLPACPPAPRRPATAATWNRARPAPRPVGIDAPGQRAPSVTPTASARAAAAKHVHDRALVTTATARRFPVVCRQAQSRPLPVRARPRPQGCAQARWIASTPAGLRLRPPDCACSLQKTSLIPNALARLFRYDYVTINGTGCSRGACPLSCIRLNPRPPSPPVPARASPQAHSAQSGRGRAACRSPQA